MEKEKLRHIIETQQFSKEWLENDFFKTVERIEKINAEDPVILQEVLKSKKIILLFWEPSSRTRSSFYSAALSLGAGVEAIEGSRKQKEGGEERWVLGFSSEIKGEIFEDTIRTFGSYYDAIVIRHPEEGSVMKAAKVIDEFDYNVSVVNAGDGPGQHPTQALLDLYTIKKELGRIDDLSVTFLGDLFYSRVVHSLVYLLAKFKVTMNFVSPSHLRLPEDIINHLIRWGVGFNQLDISEIEKAATDLLYVVRIQQERFRNQEEYLSLKGSYVVDYNFLSRLKLGENCRIFHPLPRLDEITAWKVGDKQAQDRTIDKMPQAAYFRQVKNGLFVRMGLLSMLLAPELDFRMILELHERKIRVITQCAVCGKAQLSDYGWAINTRPELTGVPKTICPWCQPKRPEEKSKQEKKAKKVKREKTTKKKK